MNRLVSLIAKCDLQDVTSLRSLSNNNQGNIYYFEGIEIVCHETHKTTPEMVRFTLRFPLSILGLEEGLHNWDIVVPDFCLREFGGLLNDVDLASNHQTGKEKFTGKFYIHTPVPKILARTSSYISDGKLNISLRVRFPIHMMAKRNVVQGRKSVKMIRKHLGRVIKTFIAGFNHQECLRYIETAKRQTTIREILKEKDLVAFIANGSILPRAKGTQLPLEGAVPFISPKEDEIEIDFPDGKMIGMGIKQGVTVITGGGYSGKSTLMDAMMAGIYDHIPGDGREYCITNENSVKICAEDGRPVTSLNITPFIRNMASVNTQSFTTGHASGSTSQAANIIEAITFGAEALFIDEDKTATNFMIRDARMKRIIQRDPIIPFTDRVRQLYRETGISTVLIIGGSSEYMDIADNVYFMNDYVLENYNAKTQLERQFLYEYYEVKEETPPQWKNPREIFAPSFSTYRRQTEERRLKERLDHDGTSMLIIGDENINISAIESIISPEQVRAIAFIIRAMAVRNSADSFNLTEYVEMIYDHISKQGLESIYTSSFTVDKDMELPSKIDVLGVVSRMRAVEYQ